MGSEQRKRWSAFLVAGALLAIGTQTAHAQSFRNRGQFTNTGTFTVRDSVIGLPSSINGTFALNGANQLVPARSYQNLSLSSPAVSTKQAAGNIYVSDTLFIGTSVTLNVPQDSVVTLGPVAGRLTELGYIAGKVSKTVVLTGGTTISDFGGIGATIAWTGVAPGSTSVLRTSGAPISANGKISIKRYFEITPTASFTSVDLTFSYSTDEVLGQNPATLDMWRLPPGDTRWRRQRVSRAGNTLTRTNLRGSGRFTAADDFNPLDAIKKYEWEADSLRLASIDSVSGNRNQLVDSAFVVRVTDAFDQSIPGALVTFSISNRPAGAANDSLTATSVSTDGNGIASTRLKLGDLNGRYEVSAAVSGSPGIAQRKFVGYARSAVAFIAKLSGDGQADSIKSTVTNPLVVRLEDSGNSGVPGTSVQFLVASTPPGGETASVADSLVVTDAQGQALTQLTLGRKIGTYVVEARSVENATVLATFNIIATHGVPSAMDTSAPSRRDTVMKQLTPFTFTITDGEANPVKNAPVAFSIVNTPAGASGQNLSVTSSITDSAGQAVVQLTLGNKTGQYSVQATSSSLPGVVKTIPAIADAAGASLMVRQSGTSQIKPILSLLDTAFTARVSDAYGNPIAGVQVRFAVVDTPNGATGHAISAATVVTDAAGIASTTLRLGLKVGSYTVQADAQGIPSVQFTAIAGAGSPRALAANQTDTVGFVLQPVQPFIVTVYDTGVNVVPNAIVTFTTVEVPTGATGYGLSTSTDTTDAFGNAMVSLQLGNRPGLYRVMASVNQLPGMIFAVNAKQITANANLDAGVDVADLTTIIDHILGRIVLTGAQFVAADLDSSGVIDINDAIRCRNYILSGGRLLVGDTSLTVVPFGTVMADDQRVASRLADIASSASKQGESSGSPVNSLAELEFTKVGVRVNLTNDVPVKGVEVYLRLKKQFTSLDSDVKFPRALPMNVEVAANGYEVRAIAYNFSNQPIDTGSGPLFRLPLAGLDTSDVDSVSITISTGTTNISTSIDNQRLVKMLVSYPTSFVLYQNYPNPFNSLTTITYDVPEIAGRVPRVAIQIFNLVGEKIRTIERSDRDAGTYVVRWDGRDESGSTVASGVYFYRLLSVDPEFSDHFATTKKMIFLK